MKKLTEEEKKLFENDCNHEAGLSERELARKYNITKGTVSRLRKSMSNLRKGLLSKHESEEKDFCEEFLKLDSQCFEVFLRLRENCIPLNGTVIKSIALKLSKKLSLINFRVSNGWLERFKKRHNLSFKNISIESKSADKSNLQEFKEKFAKALQKYKEENVFNCDETALYYKNLQRKNFVAKGDGCKGIKRNKTRMTIMLACSMTNENLNPLIIGHFKSPRPLKGFNHEEIGVKYSHSPKARMNSEIFINYLRELNQMMFFADRKILLVLDNAPSHPYVVLSNVELMFLPKNTTSIIQPLDMGIIKAFKDHYFNALINSIAYDIVGENSNDILSTN
ncbi:Tigger transposable element-derived protein 6, partial [Dictyocoela muelleri]